MPIIRVMYWKEIPVQIEFADKSTKKTIKLDDRFQAAIDSISMSDGSFGSDDYLDGWNWVVKEDSPEILNEEIITSYIKKFDNYPKNLIKETPSFTWLIFAHSISVLFFIDFVSYDI